MRGRLGWLEKIASGAIIAAGALAMSGCPPQSTETNNGPGGNGGGNQTPQVRKEDRVIPPSGPGSLVSINGNRYVFAAGGPAFSSGDVIVSGVGRGFLRKIQSFDGTDSAGNRTYITTQGTIAEGFGDGSISVKSGQAKSAISASDIKLISYSKDFDYNEDLTDGGSLRFQGYVSTGLDFIIDASISGGKLRTANISFDGDFTSNVHAEVIIKKSLSFEKRIPLGSAEWTYATLAGGWFPVVVTVEGNADLVVEANSDADAAFYGGAHPDGNISFGASFDENNGWQRNYHHDITIEYNALGACMEGNANIRAYVDLSLDARLYDVLGPYVSIQPYIEFEGSGAFPCSTVIDNPKQVGWEWTLSGGVNVPLGISADIFGERMWDWSTEDILNGKLRGILMTKNSGDSWPSGLVSGEFNPSTSSGGWNSSGSSGGGGSGGGGSGGGDGGGGTPSCNINESEQNGSSDSANRLQLCDTSTIRGIIDSQDKDYFIFHANAGDVLTFSSSPNDDNGGPSLIFDGWYVGPRSSHDPFQVTSSKDYVLYGYQTIISGGAKDYTITINRN